MELMKGTRYTATPLLRHVIEEQGRRHGWLADQISRDKSQVSRIVAGERTISEEHARVITNLLGVPFSLLWKLVETSETLVQDEGSAAA